MFFNAKLIETNRPELWYRLCEEQNSVPNWFYKSFDLAGFLCLCTCCPGTGRFSMGQNVALNAKSWTVAIDLWHKEVDDFTYGDPNYEIGKIGHYTQVLHGNHCRSVCVYSD